jgi:hypothetical protein
MMKKDYRPASWGMTLSDSALDARIAVAIAAGKTKHSVHYLARRDGYGLGLVRLDRAWAEAHEPVDIPEATIPDVPTTIATLYPNPATTKVISIYPDGRVTIEVRA